MPTSKSSTSNQRKNVLTYQWPIQTDRPLLCQECRLVHADARFFEAAFCAESGLFEAVFCSRVEDRVPQVLAGGALAVQQVAAGAVDVIPDNVGDNACHRAAQCCTIRDDVVG